MFNLNKKFKKQNSEEGSGGAAAPVEAQTNDTPESVPYSDFLELQESNKRMENHMKDILEEKKQEGIKRKQAEEEAQAQALENSKKQNNLEEFEQQITAQFQTKETGYKTEIEQLHEVILGGKKNEIIAELSSHFASPEVGRLTLGNMVNAQFTDGKKVGISFKGVDGQVVTTDKSSFLDYLKNNSGFSPLLKGPQSSGGLGSAQKPATGSAGSMEMKRDDFTKLPPGRQMEFIKSGGKIK